MHIEHCAKCEAMTGQRIEQLGELGDRIFWFTVMTVWVVVLLAFAPALAAIYLFVIANVGYWALKP